MTACGKNHSSNGKLWIHKANARFQKKTVKPYTFYTVLCPECGQREILNHLWHSHGRPLKLLETNKSCANTQYVI